MYWEWLYLCTATIQCHLYNGLLWDWIVSFKELCLSPSPCLVPVKMILLGNMVFTDVIKLRILRGNLLGLKMGLTFYDWCPDKIKERNMETQRGTPREDRGRGWRMQLHAKGWQGLSVATRSQEGVMALVIPQILQKVLTLPIFLFQIFGFRNGERMNLHCNLPHL